MSRSILPLNAASLLRPQKRQKPFRSF